MTALPKLAMLAALILAMASAVASAPLPADDGLVPSMRKTHLPSVTRVTITSSSAASTSASGKPLPQCADFKLSDQEVRRYISKAAAVYKHDYYHMLDLSPCSTSGEVAFKNGSTGTWTIQQYRAGILELSNGRTLYLSCPQCQAKGFQ